MCKGVALSLSELQIMEEFFPLKLGGSDVIFDIKQLQTFRDMMVDWKRLCMQFWEGDRLINLIGIPRLSKTLVSYKLLLKTLEHGNERYVVQVSHTEAMDLLSFLPHTAVSSVISDFEDVLCYPQDCHQNASTRMQSNFMTKPN